MNETLTTVLFVGAVSTLRTIITVMFSRQTSTVVSTLKLVGLAYLTDLSKVFYKKYTTQWGMHNYHKRQKTSTHTVQTHRHAYHRLAPARQSCQNNQGVHYTPSLRLYTPQICTGIGVAGKLDLQVSRRDVTAKQHTQVTQHIHPCNIQHTRYNVAIVRDKLGRSTCIWGKNKTIKCKLATSCLAS